MGGRYQTIQVDLSGCSPGPIAGGFARALAREASSCSGATSRFSPGVFTSDEPPGVFGAPNEAKAPDPSPKAEEALVDGEETPPDSGDIALKGFERPWELSGPNRLDERGRSTRAPSLPSAPDMDRDNLEELNKEEEDDDQLWIPLDPRGAAYFARRVHKFALSMAAGETARDANGHPGERGALRDGRAHWTAT